jgi:hypothetical protein
MVDTGHSPSCRLVLSRTDNLTLGRYSRNTLSGGWDFCLSRQHGSTTTICADIFILYALQNYLYYCFFVQPMQECSFSLYNYTNTHCHKPPAYFTFLFVPLSHPTSLKISVLYCKNRIFLIIYRYLKM